MKEDEIQHIRAMIADLTRKIETRRAPMFPVMRNRREQDERKKQWRKVKSAKALEEHLFLLPIMAIAKGDTIKAANLILKKLYGPSIRSVIESMRPPSILNLIHSK